MTDERLLQIAEMVRQMCLASGTEVHTAYTVAGAFVKGIQAETEAWSKS
jgi:hypothetical protein